VTRSVAVVTVAKGREASGLKFSRTLTVLTTDYGQRLERLRLPDFMLVDAARAEPGTTELTARRAFVEAVWETWRDCQRPRQRRKRDERRRNHTRPGRGGTNKEFINLLVELFAAIGEKPSITTLRHDLEVITSGRKHQH